MNDEQLAAIFEGKGVVTARVVLRYGGVSKGYGFVEFASTAERDAAIAVANSTVLEERQLAGSAVQAGGSDEAAEE